MSYKIVDSIHGELMVPNYMREIIATKEFQRLRNIKQLGVSNIVYTTATHHRFEHSIGTAILCIKLLEAIERNSSLKIDELHKKCVILAGLLHDIGHGAYSHLWEGVVCQGVDVNWKHEEQSITMIKHMINSNNIKLDKSKERHEDALSLIKSLITGDEKTWKKLLKQEEMFISEIVSNKFCEIDVDKCDYILRDEHHVKGSIVLKPFVEFLESAKVVYKDGSSHISYHAKDFDLIENLFENRANLHMNIYQYHQVAGVEKMVKDICILADMGGVGIEYDPTTDVLENKVANGGLDTKHVPLTEAHKNNLAYLKLDDSVLDLIENTKIDNKQVRKAKTILKNLNEKRFYKMIYESNESESREVLKILVDKFGPIFCVVGKFIPKAEVPLKIPLYNDNGDDVPKTSKLKLSYESKMIFCEDPEKISQVEDFVSSFNNNHIFTPV